MQGLRKRVTRQDGFTLAELVIVAVVIAILLAIAVPTYLGFTNGAEDTAGKANARTGQVTAKGNQALAP
jgi:type IV pilus assembly protein PilA